MAEPAPAAADTPLDDAEFAARLDPLGPFEPAPCIAVAVSGGPDSMALALLAAAWARGRGGHVQGLIVDHGLRPESAAEAKAASLALAAHRVPSRILRWKGPHPASAIQQAAREARYRLLEEACAEAGILHLLLAHHRDDQAETVAMRRARGSRAAGLAGMAAVRETRSVRILRPLLDLQRSRLLATVVARGATWIEDPSNYAPQFERGRLRAGAPLDTPALCAEALAHGALRADSENELATLLATRLRPHPAGFVRLAVDGLDDRLAAAVAGCVVCVGGLELPPKAEAVLRLCHVLDRPGAAATLGGCIVRRTGRDIVVMREPRAVAGPHRLERGEAVHWDGRFSVRLDSAAAPLDLAALGADEAQLDAQRRRRLAPLPALVRTTLPALRSAEGTVLWVHGLGATEAGTKRPIAATCTFQPAKPALPAAFLPANVVSKPDPLIYRSR